MKNSVAIVKPKPSAARQKVIDMMIEALPSENSRRAYQRHSEEFLRLALGAKPTGIE